MQYRTKTSAVGTLATLVLVVAATVGVSRATAIVNGVPADEAEFPWVVALTTPDGQQFCGGSVMTAGTIVTAAHCVQDVSPGRVRVRAGSVYLSGDAQVTGVSRIVTPDAPDRNDIAVLHLASPLLLNDRVQTVAMVDGSVHTDLTDHGSPAVVTGWGAASEHSDGADRLQSTDLVIVGDRECVAQYQADIDPDRMVCANHPAGNDSCYGDSGGPLVVHDPATDRFYQLGVVSFGITECGETAGVYTEVPFFAAFLEENRAGTAATVPEPAGHPEPPEPPTAEPDEFDVGSAPDDACRVDGELTSVWDGDVWGEGCWTEDASWPEGDDWLGDDSTVGWSGDPVTEHDWPDDNELMQAIVAHLTGCVEAGGGFECLDEAFDAVLGDEL